MMSIQLVAASQALLEFLSAQAPNPQLDFLKQILTALTYGQFPDKASRPHVLKLFELLSKSPAVQQNPVLHKRLHFVASAVQQFESQRLAKQGDPFFKGSEETKALSFGKYRVEKKLGEGGMGTVYLGLNPDTKRKVALKVMHAHLARQNAETFLEEARAAARVKTDHCVTIYDVIRDESGAPIIVSEFVPGMDGKDFLQLDSLRPSNDLPPFSLTAALLIFEQMVKGLQAAHENGLIHQDIKPENFLIADYVVDQIQSARDQRGQLKSRDLEDILFENQDRPWIKLNDWGLALFRKEWVSQKENSMSLSQLPEGKGGGTLNYMPLEQLDGTGISRRTDVFAMGLIFYELVTGQRSTEARLYGEGLDAEKRAQPLTFMIAVASAKSKSAVSFEKDPHIKKLKLPEPMKQLLEGMSARDKSERWTIFKVADHVQEALAPARKKRLKKQPKPPVEKTETPAGLTTKQASLVAVAGTSFILLALLFFWFLNRDSKDPVTPKNEIVQEKTSKNKDVQEPSSPEKVDPIFLAVKEGRFSDYQEITQLDRDAASKIVYGHPKEELLFKKLPTLDPSSAKALAEHNGPLCFVALKELDLESARELVAHRGPRLEFQSLKNCPEDLAKAFASYPHELILNQPTFLSRESIERLGQGQLKTLTFTGLETLSLRLAGAFANHKNALVFEKVKSISAREAQKLAEHKAALTLSVQSVSKSTAKALAKHRGPRLALGPLVELSPDAAKELQRYPGELELRFATSLSPDIATILSGHKGPRLSLNLRNQDIVNESLSALAKHSKPLSFHTNKNTPQSALKALSTHTGPLILSGCETLRPLQAEAFVDRVGDLSLPQLRSMSFETAQVFSRKTGVRLHCPLTDFDDAVARMLAKSSRLELALNFTQIPQGTLKSLASGPVNFFVKEKQASKSVLACLANSTGRIEIEGKPSWTFDSVSALAPFTGKLILHKVPEGSSNLYSAQSQWSCKALTINDCQQMTIAMAQNLRKLTGTIEFRNIPKLDSNLTTAFAIYNCKSLLITDIGQSSPEALKHLPLSSPRFKLGHFNKLSAELLKVVAGDKKDLKLSYWEKLTPQAAQALASHRGRLYLNGLKELTPEAALALSNHNEVLVLGGLTRLTPELARNLSLHRGELALNGIREMTPELIQCFDGFKEQWLSFDGIRELTLDQAKAWAKHPGSLSFGGLKTLGLEVATELTKHKGFWLALDGLVDIDLEVARKLSLRNYSCSLGGLKVISKELADIFAQNKEKMALDGVTQIEPRILEALTNGPKKELYLNGLKRLTLTQAKILAKFSGDLYLDGVRSLSDTVAEELVTHKKYLSMKRVPVRRDSLARILAKKQRLSLNKSEIQYVQKYRPKRSQ